MSSNFSESSSNDQGQQQELNQVLQINYHWNKRLENFQIFCKQKLDGLLYIQKSLHSSIENIKKQLDEWKLQVDSKIESQQKVFQYILENSNYLTLNDIENEETTLLNSINLLRAALQSQYNQIFSTLNINQLFSDLETPLTKKIEQNKVQIQSQKIEQKERTAIMYEIIKKSSYSQDIMCGAIAINKENSIIVEGFDNQINILEFENEKLEPIQHLMDHQSFVSCLKILQKSKQFISASYDSNIILWELNKKNKWFNKQVLKGHQSQVICLEISKNEDILISGSSDKTIIFWKIQQDKWVQYHQINCSYDVFSLSLNDSNDQLIVSICYNEILLIQQKDQKWVIEQRIPIEQYGLRLSFIENNQFILQPRDKNYLEIFTFNDELKTYQSQEKFQYKFNGSYLCSIFPIKCIQTLGLILVKNGSFLHIIRKNQSGEIQVEQSIDFKTTIFYGCMSDDGQYIFTWDNISNHIQIRKLVQ